jgi:hypothetical protein
MFMVTEAGSYIPVPAVTSAISISAGELLPFVSYGAAPIFQYKANLYLTPENITMQAAVSGGGSGPGFAIFNVQHCLNGTWLDGDRTIEITHTGNQVTAALVAGTICDEEGGNDFTGTLDGEHLSGGDLKVCNPDECVDAGLMDAADYVPYTATVAADGMSADFQWTGKFFDIVYDDNNNVVACNETSQSDEFFSITRVSFGGSVP